MIFILSDTLFIEFQEYGAKWHRISHKASPEERTHTQKAGPATDYIFNCIQYGKQLTLYPSHVTLTSLFLP